MWVCSNNAFYFKGFSFFGFSPFEQPLKSARVA